MTFVCLRRLPSKRCVSGCGDFVESLGGHLCMCTESHADFWIMLPSAKFHLTHSVYDATNFAGQPP